MHCSPETLLLPEFKKHRQIKREFNLPAPWWKLCVMPEFGDLHR